MFFTEHSICPKISVQEENSVHIGNVYNLLSVQLTIIFHAISPADFVKNTRAQDAVVKLEKPGKRKMTFAAVKDAKRRKNLCDLDNLDKKHKQGLLLVDIELSFETSFFSQNALI